MAFRRPAPLKRRDRDTDEFASFEFPPARATMAVMIGSEPARTVARDGFIRSEAWLRAVASIPCVVCGDPRTQAAHRNEGKGMGIKTHDVWAAALCQEHHVAIDSGRDMDRAERRESMDDAILLTLVALFKAGKLRLA